MEDSRLLTLLDQYASVGDTQFPDTCLELLGLIVKYLNKSQKINMEEGELTQLRAYLTKRLLNGSTSDEPRLQDRLILRNPELKGFFDSDDTMSQINKLCSTANAIKKSERKYFGFSHVHNLLHFFVHSGSASIEALKPHLDKFLQEPKEGIYFVGAVLSAFCREQFGKSELERLKILADDLLHRKVPAETFRHGVYLLALQNLIKTHKLKVDNSKFEALEQTCASLGSSKNINKFFDEIIVDDSLNTNLSVPLFEELCLNILNRPSEKPLAKLFRFFQGALTNMYRDKTQRQKRAFHLIGFFRTFLSRVDIQMILAMDIEKSLNMKNSSDQAENGDDGDSSSIADIFVSLVDFWIKQFSNKNSETKKGALEVDHLLADKIKSQTKETSLRLALLFLRVMKHSASSSLRGNEMKLMPTLLGLLYQDEKSFNQYYGLLTDRVKKSTKISELNFYLNELEHLGQISLSAKQVKEGSSEREVQLRSVVLKYLIDIFLHCETEATLDTYLGGNSKLEWNDQDLSFRKFRTRAFERVLNLVFKRDDPALLAKASELFAKQASKKNEELQSFFKSVLETAESLPKTKIQQAGLLRALVFQNIFEDDVQKNKEIVADIMKSCQMMNAVAEKSGKKQKTETSQQPEDVFVDSLIALCSTAYPQLKHIISSSFESVCDRMTKMGFSLLFQAVVRPDSEYLADDGEEDGEEQENGGSADAESEDAEENGVGLDEHDEEQDEEPEQGSLGKRKPQESSEVHQGKKGKPTGALENGSAPKKHSKDGEEKHAQH